MLAGPLADLLIAPWAIEPQRLLELQSLYAAHVRGEVPDIAAIEARLGRPLASEQQTYTVNAAGVARLEVHGVMAPKANLFMQISGGVSTQMFTQQLLSMRADGRVKSVMLEWDSPGGNVQGIPAAAAAMRGLAAEKPTVSLVRGVMASAAYWVGSAANAIYIEGQTDVLGSLGVYQRISWDQPAPNTLDLVRGRYKRASLNGQPPSAEFLAGAEQQLDYLYSVLIDAVAEHRGVDAETVERDMADGRLFTGRLAIDAGLADGMRTADELMDQLATEPSAFSRRRRVVATGAAKPPRAEAGPLTTTKGADMTPQDLHTVRHLVPAARPSRPTSPAHAPVQLSAPLPAPAPRLPPPSLPSAQSPTRTPAPQPRSEPRRVPGAEQGRERYQQQRSDLVRQAHDLAAAMQVEREKSFRAVGRDLAPGEALFRAKRALGQS
jgi:ClpP class serine protease